jgi:colanic acid/amylovoran biosynthesis protein
MKILITTIVALNPGDAAILQGSLLLLERAFGRGVEAVAVDRSSDVASRYYPWVRFAPALFGGRRRGWLGRWLSRLGYEHRLRGLDALRLTLAATLLERGWAVAATLLTSREERATIRLYLEADLVLASGGTYLVPGYNLGGAVADYEFTLRLGKRFGVLPQSLGPFVDSPLAQRLARVLGSASPLLVRDQRSRQHLIEIGVAGSRVKVVPDAAFALARPSVQDSTETRRPAEQLRVAISVREWSRFPGLSPEQGRARYLDAIAGLTDWLVRDRGARVTFISSCQGIPEYWTDDSRFAQLVLDRVPADARSHVRIDGAFRGPQELSEALREFDLVVATRMHVAILALCAGTPVLPIAYEFKTSELFDALGAPELVVPIEACDAALLVERTRGTLEALPSVQERLTRGTGRLHHSLTDAVTALLSATPAS